MQAPNERLLLIDTCGETAGVALAAGGAVIAARDLDSGKASAEVLSAIRQLLTESGWTLADLAAVGVVSGPGSFTGTRTGLAVGKGLSEGLGIALITVSRLAVLANAAAVRDAVCALDAGRGDLYLREEMPGGAFRETLCNADDLRGRLDGHRVVVAEAKVAERLAAMVPAAMVVVRPLHVSDPLALVLRSSRDALETSALAEANYVREEQDIYSRSAGSRSAGLQTAGLRVTGR